MATTPVTAAYILPLLTAFVTATTHLHPLSDEYIALINSKQNSWTAGRNFPADTSMEYIRRLMGVIKDDNIKMPPVKKHDADLIASLPDSFDPRKKWPNCPSLNDIRDQGSCGSCWAFGSVETMTDRVCTYSNGTMNFNFSAQDLLSCSNAGSCEGGYPQKAFQYWKDKGIVSGGLYNSSEGCRPYEIAPCEHHVHGNRKPCEEKTPTPDCAQKCIAGYNVAYEKDKHRAKDVYQISGEDDIKAELFKNGPVLGSFAVYNDFLSYKTGVYENTEGDIIDYHAIKILGWGVEGGKKYWLIANSWNTDWGDNGFVKFLRGVNHCDIETQSLAGEPALDDFYFKFGYAFKN